MFIKCLVLFLLPLWVRSQDVCVATLEGFRTCAEVQSCECNLIAVISDVFQADFCSAVSNSVCSANGCCPACQLEYQEYGACVDEYLATAALQRCHVDCNHKRFVAPTPAIMAAPGTINIFDLEDPSEAPVAAPTGDDYVSCRPHLLSATTCIEANQDGCSRCEVLNPPFQPQDPNFCKASTDSTCALLNCCDECRDQLEDHAYCMQDLVLQATYGDCELSCSASETPSASPADRSVPPTIQIEGSTGCFSLLQGAVGCIGKNDCLNCFLKDLSDDPYDPNFCSDVTDVVCSDSGCCPACQVELATYEYCLVLYASEVSNGQCEVDCPEPPPPPLVPDPLTEEVVAEKHSSASQLGIFSCVFCMAAALLLL